MPFPDTKSLFVVISLDVEEEGLFSGQYRRRGCTVENVRRLERLAPLSDELGFPLTLFCSHAVLTDAAACRTLETMRDRHGAEIGAHLHHWSTPPYENEDVMTRGAPTRTDRLPRELLRARLSSLLDAGRAFQGAPLTSFRMGRWDCKRVIFPLLAELGITADSSVCPLRAFREGADHFLAPATPYWPLGRGSSLLEFPVTQVPLHPLLSRVWRALLGRTSLLDRFHYLAAFSANPFWHNDAVMRMTVRLLEARGIPVLSLFWHSTEIMAGGSPHVPDEAAVERVLGRITSFLTWLRERGNARGVTLGQLRALAGTTPSAWPARDEIPPGDGDW